MARMLGAISSVVSALISVLCLSCASNNSGTSQPPVSQETNGGISIKDSGVSIPSSCDRPCAAGWFCDRGTCAEMSRDFAQSPYGAECQPPLFLPPDNFGGARLVDKCRQVYVCIEGRCSSCSSAMECSRSRACSAGPERFSGRICSGPGVALPSDASVEPRRVDGP